MANETKDRLLDLKLIAIIRGVQIERLTPLITALYAGGVFAAEVTFDQSSEAALLKTSEAIELLSERFGDTMFIGAGTVLSPAQVDLAHNAGAKYIVSPNVDRAVIERTLERGLVSIPGALTPTEILAAHGYGAHIVKVFPAGALGASYIKAVRAPIHHVPLFAVGGVDEKNAREYLDAGCAGVGLGGGLVNKQWIASGAFDRIEALARATVRAVSGGSNSSN